MQLGNSNGRNAYISDIELSELTHNGRRTPVHEVNADIRIK
jgi:hypothetical protein